MEKELQTQPTVIRKVVLALGIIVGSLILHNVKAQNLENTLLWEVNGKGIQKSYVFGTFHLMPQSDFELKEKVTKAFDQSEQIVMELDMDNPGLQMELLQNVAMEDGKTIDQFMSEEDYQRMSEFIKNAIGMNLDQIKQFKPMLIATMLVPSIIEGTPASYEMAFVQRALNQEKEILGLETPKEQTQVFDNIPYEVQVNDLIKVLNESGEMSALFEDMIESYKEEQVNEMYQMILDNMSDNSMEEFLLTRRNKNWIPKIGEMSKEKSTFFAVGAGHLGGDNGVINLLKEEGYTVKPVN